MEPRVIVISSPAAGDGKTLSAINTAGVLALKMDGDVLLLDADLRKSSVHSRLGLPSSPGLKDVLTGRCTIEEALIRTQELSKLYVLCAGEAAVNPAELLDSAQWKALIARLRDTFRYVIIDSPPIGALADCDLIHAVSDGVILVLRPDSTDRHLYMHALKTVPREKFLGVLLNCIPDWSPGKRAGSAPYYYSNTKRYDSSRTSS